MEKHDCWFCDENEISSVRLTSDSLVIVKPKCKHEKQYLCPMCFRKYDTKLQLKNHTKSVCRRSYNKSQCPYCENYEIKRNMEDLYHLSRCVVENYKNQYKEKQDKEKQDKETNKSNEKERIDEAHEDEADFYELLKFLEDNGYKIIKNKYILHLCLQLKDSFYLSIEIDKMFNKAVFKVGVILYMNNEMNNLTFKNIGYDEYKIIYDNKEITKEIEIMKKFIESNK